MLTSLTSVAEVLRAHDSDPSLAASLSPFDARVLSLCIMAGPTLSWPVRGSSRPGSDVRTELRDDMSARQGGLCPVHGGALVRAEFNHTVARGPEVKGFVRGCVFSGCHDCNARTAPEYVAGVLVKGVEVLWEHDFTRPDLVPLDWTPFPILSARRKASRG